MYCAWCFCNFENKKLKNKFICPKCKNDNTFFRKEMFIRNLNIRILEGDGFEDWFCKLREVDSDAFITVFILENVNLSIGEFYDITIKERWGTDNYIYLIVGKKDNMYYSAVYRNKGIRISNHYFLVKNVSESDEKIDVKKEFGFTNKISEEIYQ